VGQFNHDRAHDQWSCHGVGEHPHSLAREPATDLIIIKALIVRAYRPQRSRRRTAGHADLEGQRPRGQRRRPGRGARFPLGFNRIRMPR